MPKYFVYILRSSGGRRYIGFTSDLTRRISRHNKRHKGFTGRKVKLGVAWPFRTAEQSFRITHA